MVALDSGCTQSVIPMWSSEKSCFPAPMLSSAHPRNWRQDAAHLAPGVARRHDRAAGDRHQRPASAIGPAILMFYGGDLKEPVLVFPGNPSYNPTSFIWSPVNGGVPYASQKRGTLPPNLEGRRYMSGGHLLGEVRPGHPETIGREPAWPDLSAHRVGARRDCYHGAEDGEHEGCDRQPGACAGSDLSRRVRRLDVDAGHQRMDSKPDGARGEVMSRQAAAAAERVTRRRVRHGLERTHSSPRPPRSCHAGDRAQTVARDAICLRFRDAQNA